MLEIKNIERLRGEYIGGWEVMDSHSMEPVSYLNTHHYCITFRVNGKGAAILIDRNENRLLKQYHVYVCWESFDNRIYETTLSKESIGKRDGFFGFLMHHINEEYNKR
jgi:hypothetical protein